MHSLTKFMGGHGAAMGGAIVDSGRFDWHAAAPALSDVLRARRVLSRPRLHRRFGPEAFIARARSVYQRTTGAVLAPMSAFLILQGIETLALRIERHVENARKVAISCAPILASPGSNTSASRTPAIMRWRGNIWVGGRLLC